MKNLKLKQCFPLLLALLLVLAGCTQSSTKGNTWIAGTSWLSTSDNSEMIFKKDGTFIWAREKGVYDDNFFSGTYQFYIGNEAMDYLTTELADYGIDEADLQGVFTRNAEYSLENLVCYSLDHSSFMLEGTEQLTENQVIPYFGFILEDCTFLDVANMETASYYGFTKQ